MEMDENVRRLSCSDALDITKTVNVSVSPLLACLKSAKEAQLVYSLALDKAEVKSQFSGTVKGKVSWSPALFARL